MTDWRHDNYFGPNEFTNMKYKTPENIEQLARDSVDSWDDKCLYQFAVDMVTENFENCDEEEFKSQWHNYYGEDA